MIFEFVTDDVMNVMLPTTGRSIVSTLGMFINRSLVRRPLLSAFALLAGLEVVSTILTRLLPSLLPLEIADIYSLLAGNAIALAQLQAVGENAPRRVLLLMGTTAWAWRLAFFLLRRTARGFSDERLDGMRGSSRGAVTWGTLQTVWVFITLLPVWIGLRPPVNTSPIGVVDAVAIIGFLIAWLMEAVADEQRAGFVLKRERILRGFRTKYGSDGTDIVEEEERKRLRWCSTGLFRLCRFPNYFGEWFMWVCMSVMGFRSTNHWSKFIIPLSPWFVYMILHKASIRLAVEKMQRKLSAEEFEEWNKIPLFFPGLKL